MYVALVIAAIILLGILVYMFRLDARLIRLENEQRRQYPADDSRR